MTTGIEVVAYLIQRKDDPSVRGVRLQVDRGCYDDHTETFDLMTVAQHERIVAALAQTEQQPVAVPEGWRLVPVEPTREMWEASGNAVAKLTGVYVHHDIVSRVVFDAMLSAAPIAQTVQQPTAFCEDAALSIAERTFSTEVDEQLASDIIQYARRLHSLYAAPIAQATHPDAALREQIRSMVAMLENREWANLLSTDEDIARLDSAITALVGERDQFRALIAECVEYLNTDHETSIGSGSALHRKLIAATAEKEGV